LGGCGGRLQLFSGYPITPATTIYNTMLKLLPPKGGVCLQGEDEIAMMQQRLKEKIVEAVADFTYFEETLVPEADTLVVTYGITARTAKVAVERLKEKGQPTSRLVLKTLWPVPEALICKKAAPYKRVVVAEMKLGKYVREIQRLLPGKEVAFMG